MPPLGEAALVAAVAYLAGSIPFGLVFTTLAGRGDIRRIGSGNIGATNVLRTGSKALAAATLLCDIGKGALAVLWARRYGGDMAALAAVAAVVGHMFPPWLRFNGGKGVATAAGVLLVYVWPVGLASGVAWLVAVLATRYVSVAAIVAALLAPVFAWLLTGAARPTETAAIIAILVILRHRSNVARLMRGEESRLVLGRKS
ncbi:MAG TPA: glycerol-3-phosphate 1-O-acyltransferase PlsY [Stellaceae bacterium]|nr:glycerol-3-phosphate 1-O-acyltransferase PlsY [Stellaceae bacterium]